MQLGFFALVYQTKILFKMQPSSQFYINLQENIKLSILSQALTIQLNVAGSQWNGADILE